MICIYIYIGHDFHTEFRYKLIDGIIFSELIIHSKQMPPAAVERHDEIMIGLTAHGGIKIRIIGQHDILLRHQIQPHANGRSPFPSLKVKIQVGLRRLEIESMKQLKARKLMIGRRLIAIGIPADGLAREKVGHAIANLVEGLIRIE